MTFFENDNYALKVPKYLAEKNKMFFRFSELQGLFFVIYLEPLKGSFNSLYKCKTTTIKWKSRERWFHRLPTKLGNSYYSTMQ